MNRYLKSYRKDQFMIADHVARYPLEIWNWGIANRSGHLRSVPQDVVRLNLLPHEQASVTPKGIYFGDELYYICDLAMREGWMERARIRGNWDIEVAFDPRTVDYIYLPLNGGTQLEVCSLTLPSKHLSGRDLHDAKDYFASEKLAEEAAKTRIQQSEAQLHAQRSRLVSEAREKTQAAHAAVGKLSKRARKKDIRGNRSEVRQSERSQQTWKLGTVSLEEEPGRTTSQDSTSEEYVPPSSRVSQIRNIRDKKWRQDDKE